MPFYKTEDDYRREMFWYILLFAFDASLSMIRGDEFHGAIKRYLRELTIRGISKTGFHLNITNGTYPEVNRLILDGIDDRFIAQEKTGHILLRLSLRGKHKLLRDQTVLTVNEVLDALSAAQVTYTAYCSRTLDEKSATRAE